MPITHSASSKLATASAAERIDVVLFDYGQVLSAPADPAAWARIRVITGLDEARLFAAYWEYRHQYDSGALTGPAYWSAVAAHAGIALDEEQRSALFAADIDLWTALNQPMVEWAWRLQSAGIRTGVLSNIGDCIGVGIVDRLPWLAAFDHCTWSYSLLLAKPDPEIYRKTAEALDSAPAHILFIDDREENIAAAAALGFQTQHYTNHAAFESEMRRRGLSFLLDAGMTEKNTESFAETLAR